MVYIVHRLNVTANERAALRCHLGLINIESYCHLGFISFVYFMWPLPLICVSECNWCKCNMNVHLFAFGHGHVCLTTTCIFTYQSMPLVWPITVYSWLKLDNEFGRKVWFKYLVSSAKFFLTWRKFETKNVN